MRLVQEAGVIALDVALEQSAQVELSPDFSMEEFLDPRPEWVVPFRLATEGNHRKKFPNPVYVSIKEHMEAAYATVAEQFRTFKDWSVACVSRLIGPHNQAVETVVLTSFAIPLRDALTFLYHRRRQVAWANKSKEATTSAMTLEKDEI